MWRTEGIGCKAMEERRGLSERREGKTEGKEGRKEGSIELKVKWRPKGECMEEGRLRELL